jgi:exonuclease III
VNGVRKFRHLPHEISFLKEHDVVLLQETFARSDSELLELSGFFSHHQRALPGNGYRNIWGVSSYFRQAAFADGFWTRVFSPVDWLLISRWQPGSEPGLVVLNVYIPVHTAGMTAIDASILRETLVELVSVYPGDSFIVAGDFNFARGAVPASRITQ